MEPDICSGSSLTPSRLAFRLYLRTGRRVPASTFAVSPIEAKFNPNHDPSNGQFTFGLGGGFGRTNPFRMQVQNRANPRVRIGGNSGAFRDPMTLEHVFPGLSVSPGGAIVALADNILDLTGPGKELTDALTVVRTRQLIAQIRAIDPSYRFDSLGLPETLAGQNRQLQHLEQDRAAALYRVQGDARPLQVETLRFAQRHVDGAYTEGLRQLQAGSLNVRLSPEEAVGNFIDRSVRSNMRNLYNRLGISTVKGDSVRVIGREYDTSGSDRTFRVPDARVGDVAFDWTLTRKTTATPQIRGFFSSDVRPEKVVIVRPSQLGTSATYVIKRPGK